MPDEAEIHIVAARIAAMKADLASKRVAQKPDEKPKPNHLTPLQLAISIRRGGGIMRKDWLKAWVEAVESGNVDPYG